MLNRENILARRLPTETIAMPEWGGDVTVRRLTAAEYLSLVARIKDDSTRAVYYWITAACFDADGKRIFNDDDVTSIEQSLDFVIVTRLIEAILRLNPQKDDAAKALPQPIV